MRQGAPQEPTRVFWPPERLQDDPDVNTLALGCRGCPDVAACGGLHTEAGIFDCRDLCSCEDPERCDVVCRKRALLFFQRFKEVKGFEFDNAPRVPILQSVSFPDVVPFVADRHSRIGVLNESVVALPLSKLIHLGTGEVHARTRKELSQRFLVPENASIILTGVDRDYRIEAWWALPNKADIFRTLRDLAIDLVTIPNFSLFTNVPRPDNLHAMKRILLTWTEFVGAGIPSALHVNARTYHDYLRWTHLIAARPEVKAIAFEFGTGAGRSDRLDWHVDRLCELADAVGRPLKLALRGGWRALDRLRTSFEQVILIETAAFSRAMRRRRATINEEAKLRWRPALTQLGTPLDHLLAHNISVVRLALELGPQSPNQGSETLRNALRSRTSNANSKARQASFMPQLDASTEAGTMSADNESVIITTKP